MRCLVTGGLGFIGSSIALALAKAGHRVAVLDNLRTGLMRNMLNPANLSWNYGIMVHVGDIRHPADLAVACRDVDVVFHEAAIAEVPYSFDHPEEVYEVNTLGTVNVLEAARRAGVRRVVFASTSAVYGSVGLDHAKREDEDVHPESPYAASKAASEILLKEAALRYQQLDTVSLRYFNVYGPKQRPDSAYAAVIPKFIASALIREPLTIFGDGAQTRDFIYIDELVRLNLLVGLATDQRFEGRVFNAGTGCDVSVHTVAGLVKSCISGTDVRFAPKRTADPDRSVADCSRATCELGFRNLTSLVVGFERTLEFLGGVRAND